MQDAIFWYHCTTYLVLEFLSNNILIKCLWFTCTNCLKRIFTPKSCSFGVPSLDKNNFPTFLYAIQKGYLKRLFCRKTLMYNVHIYVLMYNALTIRNGCVVCYTRYVLPSSYSLLTVLHPLIWLKITMSEDILTYVLTRCDDKLIWKLYQITISLCIFCV